MTYDFVRSLSTSSLMKRRKVFAIAILALVVLPVIFPPAKGTSDYETQPEDYDSTLPVNTISPEIPDDALAILIEKCIWNYKDMVFVFGQCFGGGFIDDLRGVTAGHDPVAIMSASKHNESSWGSTRKDGESFFLKAFANALDENSTATIKWLFYWAEENDTCGPHQKGWEDPQFFSQPQPAGDNIRIHDGTSNNYAILYVGYPNHWRHWNNLERIYNILKGTYGYTDNDIFVLYDSKLKPDGTPTPLWVDMDATWANLIITIQTVGMLMDSDATLFFWVNDHGGIQKKIMNGEEYLRIPSNGCNSTYFALTSDFIGNLRESITYQLPCISLNYTGATANNTVYFNDHFIGELPSYLNRTCLEIDPTIVPLYEENNNLTIKSLQNDPLIAANISLTVVVPEAEEIPVGGVWVPVDKLGLLAPYIALASTILVATATTVIYVKHVKHRKKKQ